MGYLGYDINDDGDVDHTTGEKNFRYYEDEDKEVFGKEQVCFIADASDWAIIKDIEGIVTHMQRHNDLIQNVQQKFITNDDFDEDAYIQMSIMKDTLFSLEFEKLKPFSGKL